MKINRDKRQGCHYINSLGIVVSNSNSGGKGDSLGRTALAALIFEEDREELIAAVKSYFILAKTSPENGYHTYVCRYPNGDPKQYLVGGSRDHVVYSIGCLKILGEDTFVKDFLNNKAKRPCIQHPYTLGQKVWFKALYSKFWSWVLAIGRTPWLVLWWALLNPILNTFGLLWKVYENPTEYHKYNKKYVGAWAKFIYKCKVPTFAWFYGIFEVNSMASESAKKYLQFMMRPLFEKHNYVAKALLGAKVKFPEEYVPSRKNRWTIRLDRACNRTIYPYTKDTAENNMELAILKYVKDGNL